MYHLLSGTAPLEQCSYLCSSSAQIVRQRTRAERSTTIFVHATMGRLIEAAFQAFRHSFALICSACGWIKIASTIFMIGVVYMLLLRML